MFQFEQVELNDFRCFENIQLSLERDLTVLFAENGGGKSTLLSAIAFGMALFQPRSPKALKLDLIRDTRKYVVDNQNREQAETCGLKWKAVSHDHTVAWSVTGKTASGRSTRTISDVQKAIEDIRKPSERWPLFAWYGTNRMQHEATRRKPTATGDRWDGYASSLEPTITDGPLLEWLEREILGDLVRHRKDEDERRFDQGVFDAMIRATPTLQSAWYDPIERAPVVQFQNGHIAAWHELSDGFHIFVALVGDIARRAILLNAMDGAMAPQLIEGTVLIDEIDLHLHPRWQRIVLKGLRDSFPKLQFIVSTHSPQVLSSAENRQVRRLVSWQLVSKPVFVEGRDSNAILRDQMNTTDRDEEGIVELRRLHEAIDREDWPQAIDLYNQLFEKWGDLDPNLTRAKVMIDWGNESNA